MTEISFLNWNINKLKFADINNYLDPLLEDLKPDVLTLLEANSFISSNLEDYTEIITKAIVYKKNCKTIKILKRTNSDFTIKINNSDNPHFLSTNIVIENNTYLYLPIHFPSKAFRNEDEQQTISINVKNDINELLKLSQKETQKESINCIIAGDFNMEPHEKSMTKLESFFCLRSRKHIESSFKFDYTKYFPFYNPTWMLYTDYDIKSNSKKPEGTYFYAKKQNYAKYWYLIDQVIMNKNLSQNFDNQSFKICNQIFKNSSLSEEIENKKTKLDHLPIYFKFKF